MGELGTLLKEERHMDKIIDYDVIKSITRDDLVAKVNEQIDKGWQPFVHGAERVGDCWYQTIVMYEGDVNRIVDYDVVFSNQVTDLTRKVSKRLNAEGWQPFGGGAERVKRDWYQTVVIYGKPEEE